MTRAWLIIASFACVACAQTPGEHIGDFDVTQQLLENSCGAGALPAPDPLVFRAELREKGHQVYWRYESRERYIAGSQSNGALTFTLQTSMEQPVELSDGSTVTCRLNQLESLELSAGDDEDMRMLTGSNQILLAGANPDCAYLTQARGGPFLALPCQVSYDVEALRIDGPVEDDPTEDDPTQDDSATQHADGGAADAMLMP